MSRTSITSKNKVTGLILLVFALVTVAVGVLLISTNVAGPGKAFPVWGWAVMVLTAAPLLIIGAVLVARGLRIDRTAKSGLAGEATVLSATKASYGVGSSDSNDYRVTPVLKLVLQVTVPGHTPYEAKVNEIAPGVRRFQMQPGATLPVRVDPKKLSRVVVDWDRSTAATIGQLGAQGLTLPGIQFPGAVPVGTLPIAALTMPVLPVVPYTGTETPDSLRATVRQVGLPGTATIDAVVPAGTGGDGRLAFVLGMWVNIGGPSPMRVDNAPAAVEPHLAHKVAVGATVPVRVAQIGTSQATVLLWDEA